MKKGGFAAGLQRRVSLCLFSLFVPSVPFARLCSLERQVGHLPSSGTPSGVYHEGAALHLRVLDVLVVVEVLEFSRRPARRVQGAPHQRKASVHAVND